MKFLRSNFVNFFGFKTVKNKKIQTTFLKITGVGLRSVALLSSRMLKVSPVASFYKLTKKNIYYLTQRFEKLKVSYGSSLVQLNNRHMSNLRLEGTMRYRRRGDGLPVRGQRTHSNAMTFRRYYVKYAHLKNRKIANKNRRFYFTRKPRKIVVQKSKARRRSWRK
jgi:ribosomal protein S13